MDRFHRRLRSMFCRYKSGGYIYHVAVFVLVLKTLIRVLVGEYMALCLAQCPAVLKQG